MAAVLLAAIAVALVLAGVYAFLDFRQIARSHAEKTATRIARDVSERVANQYLQENFLPILAEYEEMMAGSRSATNAQGDEIAHEESSDHPS